MPARNPDGGDAESAGGAEPPEADVAAALREVRREGYKAAALTAAVYGTLALLVANAALTLGGVDGRVLVPLDAVGRQPVAVRARSLAAGAVAVVVFAGTALRRARAPLVEQFEAGNPEVEEALRTARDAVARDATDPVARTLYRDVVDALAETSSAAFLDQRRLAAALALVVVVSVATLHASVAGVVVVDVTPGGPGAATAGAGGQGAPDGADRGTPASPDRSLGSGEEVLGEPTNVSAGGENLSATIDAGGAGTGSQSRDRSTDSGGADGRHGTAVDAQRAGYDAPDPVDDADLVREYASRIQEANESV